MGNLGIFTTASVVCGAVRPRFVFTTSMQALRAQEHDQIYRRLDGAFRSFHGNIEESTERS